MKDIINCPPDEPGGSAIRIEREETGRIAEVFLHAGKRGLIDAASYMHYAVGRGPLQTAEFLMDKYGFPMGSSVLLHDFVNSDPAVARRLSEECLGDPSEFDSRMPSFLRIFPERLRSVISRR